MKYEYRIELTGYSTFQDVLNMAANDGWRLYKVVGTMPYLLIFEREKIDEFASPRK